MKLSMVTILGKLVDSFLSENIISLVLSTNEVTLINCMVGNNICLFMSSIRNFSTSLQF